MKTNRATTSQAFTLIEIMVVVGVMGVLLTMGIPSILKVIKREGMRKAVKEVQDVCSNARARAIFSGTQAEVVFHPLEKRFEVGGTGGAASGGEGASERPSRLEGEGLSGQLPNEITIEMLDVNLLEYRESEVAHVRFFPNGTSDEMTLILRSDKNEFRKIWLEVTTALTDWTTIE
jgi:prepilin-type N-terminal cleavage/methylation domain-containing protein